ncbi:MAG TPA: RnfABCDGE type electron transport complex subunit D, partial [Steroidobacteraceae bacterium]|nr:RnfABCDGE type electron transport complex subunit D [Steroidobacteraceae bacterium]
MQFETSSGPHLTGRRRVSSLMRDVLLALVPYAIVHVLLLGPGLLLQLAIAVPTALGCEALALRIRERPQ